MTADLPDRSGSNSLDNRIERRIETMEASLVRWWALIGVLAFALGWLVGRG